MQLGFRVIAVLACVFLFANTASAQLLSTDFSDDGGFTVVDVGGPEGPWSHDAGAGTWSADGSTSLGAPSASMLNSPEVTVGQSGGVTLTLNHRYSFEGPLVGGGSIRWDAGQIRISVNGGPFRSVKNGFIQNGYAKGPIRGNNAINGQAGFNDQSAGYDAGQFISTIVSLGSFSAGDTLVVQFIGAWDEGARGLLPNWEIDGLEIADGQALPAAQVPALGTWGIALLAAMLFVLGGVALSRRRAAGATA